METVRDEKLKAYFLGELAAEEAERLEEELAADAELTERASVVEAELADEYLRGALSAAERRSFEENYLTTEARRRKLRSAEMLWKIAAENRTAAESAAPAFWKNISARYRILIFSGLAAAVLFGGFVLIRLNSDKNSEIVRQVNVNQSPNFNALNQTVETTVNINAVSRDSNLSPTNSDSQKNALNAAPKPTVAPATKPTPKPIAPPAPTLATFVLAPGTLRSEGEQFIKIPPQIDKISLRLTPPKDAAKYQTYRAVLQTADGATVFTAPNLKSLNLSLAAENLQNRTYIVFLEGQNPTGEPAEPVAEYTFRVRR